MNFDEKNKSQKFFWPKLIFNYFFPANFEQNLPCALDRCLVGSGNSKLNPISWPKLANFFGEYSNKHIYP